MLRESLSSLSLFYVVSQSLQACLGELFQARLGALSPGQEVKLGELSSGQGGPFWDLHGTPAGSRTASLLERLHRPCRGLLSPDVRTVFPVDVALGMDI